MSQPEAAVPQAKPEAAPAAAQAPVPGPTAAVDDSSARQRPRPRPRQDAPVVMPGGAAAVDRLGMQFGTLNFMAGEEAEEAGARFGDGQDMSRRDGAPASAHAPAPAPAAAPAQPAAAAPAPGPEALAGASPFAAGGQLPSSGYLAGYGADALDSNQRLNMYSGYSAFGAQRDDKGAQGAATPAGAAPVAGTPGPESVQPGMQQFPGMMPYYYPYYMPNQFQQYSPAGGFAQYPLYGGQPQPAAKPEAGGLSSPNEGYAQTPNAYAAMGQSYDAQGFARAPALGGHEFKVHEGTPGGTSIPGLGGFFQAPGVPAGKPGAAGTPSGAPAGSSPLDYRFDANGKSPAPRAAPAPGMPRPVQAQAQQTYYPYAGFGQNGYGGYAYGRQQYWG